MRNRRTGSRQRGRSDGSFWLSFSDLMSSLVLIFILVMFYIIYQYFNLAEINQAEIARREYQLSEAQAVLETQQTKLTDAEKQMIAQQILLDAKEKELTDAQAVLESQKTQLASTQAQLTDKEAEIAAQQAQLDALSVQLTTQQNQLAIQQGQLEDQTTQLAIQQSQLDDQTAQLAIAQGQLEDQTAQLATQQSQISAQQAQLQNQQMQLEALVGVRTRIITSLSSALKESGISATVDPVNGSIALESDVLFSSGQYTLSAQGKDFIDSFLPVYLDVLFSEEYRPYVAEIIVEGHTDSDGGYLSNLELSQQRALAVASYVLGNSCRTVSNSVKTDLRQVVTVNGRSYSDRIFDEAGREDKDASRRVVFKFRLTDEQMIQQMRQILEAQ